MDISYKTPHTIMCAVDGSDASEMAFYTAMYDVMREECDTLIVGHISNEKKDYLPWNMRATHVKETYEGRLLALGAKGRYSTRDVGADQTTKEALWDLAKENDATIICVGNHGRKGPKKDETVCGT